nr:ribonuclease III [Alcanivorax sp. 1008]
MERLEDRLGHRFSNRDLLTLALTHRSASRRQNNERLEFLGDSLLSEFISVALFKMHPAATEGQLTRMRASLVRGVTLAELGSELGVGNCLALGGGELKSGGFRRESILADAVEALIGAIYLDAGQRACEQCVLHWFAGRLAEVSPDSADKDPKTALQEWLQGRQLPLPEYQVLEVHGQAPKQQFDVECRLQEGDKAFVATGASRRKAEQAAARAAMSWLEQQHGR